MGNSWNILDNKVSAARLRIGGVQDASTEGGHQSGFAVSGQTGSQDMEEKIVVIG